MSLPKPLMRGMLARSLKLKLSLSLVGTFAVVFLYKYIVVNPRKLAYTAFNEQYDAVKDFNAMREAGVFESVQPTGK